MKLKCRPEDFVVRETIDRVPTSGPFALYLLHKSDIGTLEAIQQIRRAWNLSGRQVSHAGLKDRHARTSQWIVIRNGPKTGLQWDHLQLVYHGQTDRSLDSGAIRSNHFEIVIRRLTSVAAKTICERIVPGDRPAIPNYFDQQRFGSLGFSGEFTALACCRRDYERAVWLMLADPNPHDRSEEIQQKQILRDHWGNWAECRGLLKRSHRRSIVTYLDDHPTGFRRAFALIRPELRGLCLSAFQSAVWNRMLAEYVAEQTKAFSTCSVGDTELQVGFLSPQLISTLPDSLPLPSARCRNIAAETRALANRALVPYGLTLPEMKLSFPRDRFFARGIRHCWIRPDEIRAQSEPDELYPGFQAVRLEFELPSGCYATLVIKALTAKVNGGDDAGRRPEQL